MHSAHEGGGLLRTPARARAGSSTVRSHSQAGTSAAGPALGGLDEHVDLLRSELEMTEHHDQLVGLGVGQREISAHLGERIARRANARA